MNVLVAIALLLIVGIACGLTYLLTVAGAEKRAREEAALAFEHASTGWDAERDALDKEITKLQKENLRIGRNLLQVTEEKHRAVDALDAYILASGDLRGSAGDEARKWL